MSVTTGRGDDGETDLLFGKRISKCDPRMVAIGAVDELNAALGLARVGGLPDDLEKSVDEVQKTLVGLMGELATLPDDRERYLEQSYPVVDSETVARITGQIRSREAGGISFSGWVRPGASHHAAGAGLDFARTICRRAEREVLALGVEAGNPQLALYLNRVSDLMWVLARKLEGEGDRGPEVGIEQDRQMG